MGAPGRAAVAALWQERRVAAQKVASRQEEIWQQIFCVNLASDRACARGRAPARVFKQLFLSASLLCQACVLFVPPASFHAPMTAPAPSHFLLSLFALFSPVLSVGPPPCVQCLHALSLSRTVRGPPCILLKQAIVPLQLIWCDSNCDQINQYS